MSEYYTDNNTAGYDNNGGGNGYNKRSFNDPQQDQQHGGGYHGGKRVKKGQDGIEMRCLVPSRCAGAIIGKGGSNIKELRESFQASVFLPDGQANERVLKVSASPQNCGEVLLKVLPKLEENSRDRYNQDEEQQEQSYNTSAAIKLLVHQSQAGGIIGTKGVRIKELREKTGAFIKVHQECAGASTDRICQVSGSHDVIAECVKLIMELLETIPPKGPVYNYDPSEDMGFGGPGMDDFGYGGGFGFGGGDFGYGGPPRGGGGFRGGRGRGGARGRGGFGDRGGRGRGGRGGRGGGFRGGRGAQAQSHQY